MNIVGKDGYSVPGLDLPPGTLVKWVNEQRWKDLVTDKDMHATLVRHTEKPIPEKWWNIELENTVSYMSIGEYQDSPEGPVELEPFFTKFVTSQVPE